MPLSIGPIDTLESFVAFFKTFGKFWIIGLSSFDIPLQIAHGCFLYPIGLWQQLIEIFGSFDFTSVQSSDAALVWSNR